MKKVLLLSTHDSHLGGHAWSTIKMYDSQRYDVRLVSLYSETNDKTYAILHNYSLYKFLNRVINVLSRIIKFHQISRNFSLEKYCYLKTASFPVTADLILKKYNNGVPDIIVLHWYDGFITPKILKELYDKTKAKIVFVFTDEYPLGGGCHYPCECEGYKMSCNNCPALKKNKKIAERRLSEKVFYLSSIPKVVISPTAGIEKAKESLIFRNNTTFLTEFRGIQLQYSFNRNEIRESFDIRTDDFVIMFGAMSINEERKGIKYLLEALKILSQQIDKDIIALIPGHINEELDHIKNIKFRYLGFLTFEELCKAYTAADVYISPSIADSGPMMVIYSIACGTPVVAFPVGYAIDFVQHKITGYLANYMDVNDLADGILYFYKNREREKEFRMNCLELNASALNNDFWGNSL